MMARSDSAPDGVPDADEVELDDGRHPVAAAEEWVFAAWTADASLGVISGHRIVGRRAWYWAALARRRRPLLHVTDFEIPVRSDPFILKGESLWAEHQRISSMEQWSIGNETYASALDDPDEALGRCYGTPTPIAFDLEWYATDVAELLDDREADSPVEDGTGYEQAGVVHGAIEVLGEPTIELVEVPARRWHRWTPDGASVHLAPNRFPRAAAHSGVRAPFAFPDSTVLDLVLTPDGWASRIGSSTLEGHDR